MTKFIEALEAQVSRYGERRVKPEPMKLSMQLQNGRNIIITNLQEYIDAKLSKIAESLPITVNNPDGFGCGYDTGYKQAMLDLERFLYKDGDANQWSQRESNDFYKK